MNLEDRPKGVLWRPTPLIPVEAPKEKTFEPSKYFNSENSQVKFSHIDQNFQHMFLGIVWNQGKEVYDSAKEKYEESRKNKSVDFTYRTNGSGYHTKDIFAAIKSHDNDSDHFGISKLHHIYTILEKHAHLEKLGLGGLILGKRNIFFAEDFEKKLRRVSIEDRGALGWEIWSSDFFDTSCFVDSHSRIFFRHNAYYHNNR